MGLDDKLEQDDAKAMLETVIGVNSLMNGLVIYDYLSPVLGLGLNQPEGLIITSVLSLTSLLVSCGIYYKLKNSASLEYK